MAFQPGATVYTQAFGSRPENVEVPFISDRAPTTSDVNYPIGKRWVFLGTGEYILLSQSSTGGVLTSNWALTGSTGGALNTLTGSSGTATPVANNIQIAGTGGQVTTAAAGAVVTVSLPAAITTPGSLATTTTLTGGTGVTATTGGVTASAGNIVATLGNITTGAGSITSATTLTATLGAITATNGNLVLGTAGNKIVSSSVGTTTAAGANSFGTVTLAGGTATVATTAITTNSIVFLTRQTIGATGAAVLGILSRGTIVNGVSFVINALSQTDATALQASDVSNVGWMIVN